MTAVKPLQLALHRSYPPGRGGRQIGAPWSTSLAGRATIRGLRITVAHVVNLVAKGMTPEQIVADLADLEEEDVRLQ